jgi:3-oxoacyl-[acyl-carrier-protein] synthase II
MVEIVVTGIGLVSGLGRLESSWQRSLLGESAIQLHQPFAELPPLPLAMIGNTPADLNWLTKIAVADALEDANLVPPLPNFGVVIGSSRSCQASWEKMARQEVDLSHWLDTLPNQAAIAAARQIGSTAPVLAPMAACATGIWAIAQGMQLIETGQCQQAIAGAIEAPITPLTLAGFQQMGALATTGCYPFDRRREGLVLGEGGAVLVLESGEVARRRGAKIYGQILGYSFTSDAYHTSAPDPDGWQAIASIKQCLERSCLTPTEINYIHAHGTSTKLNDSREAKIIQYLFPQGVAVSSTKGGTGHTLGASGVLGIAFCLMALKEQILPPCTGLSVPEFDLDLAIASRKTSVEKVLCFSFGFGGQNAVLALTTTL